MKKLTLILILSAGAAAMAWAQDATAPISDTRLATDPVTCTAGKRYFNTATNLARICGPDNTWSNMGSGTPGGTSGQLQDNNGGAFRGITLGGDCTYASPNITCTKTSGSVFGAMALLTATAATDLSGTWPNITVAKLNGQLPSVSNTPSTVVIRDGSGNIAFGTATGNLTGSASTITGQVVAGNLTVLTTSQDILYRAGSGLLARLPIVTNGSCLGASAGAWATLSCGGGSAAFAGINPQTTAYTLVTGDNGKLVTSNGSSLTDLLPAAPPSATWTAGLQNLNATALTVSRNGLLINGAASNINLLQYQSIYAWTDGANYFVPQRPLAAGTGALLTESATAETISADTAIVLTNANAQAGKPTYCADSSGTTAYACLGSPTLLAYTTGMQVFLNPSTTCTTSCSLNIDLVGNKAVKLSDGSNDPNGILVAGQPQWLWYDGTVFRMVQNSIASNNAFFIDATCAAIGGPQCYATPALALAAANAVSGRVYNWVPGTYTIASTLSIGSATTQVWMTNGPGVVYNCTITNGSSCIQLFDGSVFEGPPGYTFGANGTNTKLTFANNAHVANGITNAEQDGSQQSATVRGIYCVGNFSGLIIDQACFHIRGLFSSTGWEGLNSTNLPNTIGLLADTPSNATVTASGTASGTTVTLTTSATSDASPDGHHTWIGGTIVVSGCSDTAYNGTVVVTATTDNTHIKYTSAGSPGATATGCSYVPTNVLAITSVIDFRNVVINMTNNTTTHTGGRPIVVSDRGGMGNITCHDLCNAEGGTPGGPAIQLAGNGVTGNNSLNTITFENVHCEPASGDTGAPTCIAITDAHNVIIKGINGSGCTSCVGSNLVTVSQSAANRAHNITILGASKNSWNNIELNNVNPAFTTPSAITDLGHHHFPGISTDIGTLGTFISPVRTVTFSSTPVFDMNTDQFLTLTGNVSSSTVINALAGSTVRFTICQDATGSRTFVWPTALHGATTIGSTASKCTSQAFQSPDGTTFYALAAAVINQ